MYTKGPKQEAVEYAVEHAAVHAAVHGSVRLYDNFYIAIAPFRYE